MEDQSYPVLPNGQRNSTTVQHPGPEVEDQVHQANPEDALHRPPTRGSPVPQLHQAGRSPSQRASSLPRRRLSSRQSCSHSRISPCGRTSRQRSRSRLDLRYQRQPRSRSRHGVHSPTLRRALRSSRPRDEQPSTSLQNQLLTPRRHRSRARDNAHRSSRLHDGQPSSSRCLRELSRSPCCHRSPPRNDSHHCSRLRDVPPSPSRSLRSHLYASGQQQHAPRRKHRSRSPLPCVSEHDGSIFRGNVRTLSKGSKDDSTLNLLIQALKTITPDSNKVNSVHNTVPEFDPARKEQTMTIWLHKVNECATIYGWSEKQVVHYSLPKLKGVAKRWYEGLPSVLFSWKEWQAKLLAAFPSDENYGQMLTDMLARRAKFDDSLEDYFYDKIALINRCGITNKRAIECVLHGIDDHSVRLGAEAAQFEDLDKLLTYLRNSRNVKTVNADKQNTNKILSTKNTDIQPTQNTNQPVRQKIIRCLNCKREGHMLGQCTVPIKKCGKCFRVGHDTEKCYSNLPQPEKSVNLQP